MENDSILKIPIQINGGSDVPSKLKDRELYICKQDGRLFWGDANGNPQEVIPSKVTTQFGKDLSSYSFYFDNEFQKGSLFGSKIVDSTLTTRSHTEAKPSYYGAKITGLELNITALHNTWMKDFDDESSQIDIKGSIKTGSSIEGNTLTSKSTASIGSYLILGQGSYGESLPTTNLTEGRLFFKLIK